VSRPDPSHRSDVRLTVTYEHDIDAAAEALLALLRRAPQRDRASRTGLNDDETNMVDEESAA
jgi:hypothetical protein